ncbi:hypothetical protein QMQ05_13150 [Glutamicibacter ectropisis]|uniref:Uncharacterized protein n=1 Tax=Glutamicibacter ectropisis TaxID=3046593 RepID=A0AAU6WCA2_9MICC
MNSSVAEDLIVCRLAVQSTSSNLRKVDANVARSKVDADQTGIRGNHTSEDVSLDLRKGVVNSVEPHGSIGNTNSRQWAQINVDSFETRSDGAKNTIGRQSSVKRCA